MKSVLITGTNKGIGLETAKQLSKEMQFARVTQKLISLTILGTKLKMLQNASSNMYYRPQRAYW